MKVSGRTLGPDAVQRDSLFCEFKSHLKSDDVSSRYYGRSTLPLMIDKSMNFDPIFCAVSRTMSIGGDFLLMEDSLFVQPLRLAPSVYKTPLPPPLVSASL